MDKMITNLNVKNLYSKENKIEWFGEGEWIDEPDCVTFEYKGYKCLIFRVVKKEACNEFYFGGHLCGYILLPIEHPLYGTCLSEINCHGGLTFSECDAEFPEYEGKKGHIIGFDCAHSYDLCPSMEIFIKEIGLRKVPHYLNELDSSYKTVQYCIDECKSIVNQVITLEMQVK